MKEKFCMEESRRQTREQHRIEALEEQQWRGKGGCIYCLTGVEEFRHAIGSKSVQGLAPWGCEEVNCDIQIAPSKWTRTRSSGLNSFKCELLRINPLRGSHRPRQVKERCPSTLP